MAAAFMDVRLALVRGGVFGVVCKAPRVVFGVVCNGIAARMDRRLNGSPHYSHEGYRGVTLARSTKCVFSAGKSRMVSVCGSFIPALPGSEWMFGLRLFTPALPGSGWISVRFAAFYSGSAWIWVDVHQAQHR